jgi:DNA topoisomerase IB
VIVYKEAANDECFCLSSIEAGGAGSACVRPRRRAWSARRPAQRRLGGPRPARGACSEQRDVGADSCTAIPPAWTDVWIAACPNAHLQATGVDSKGRRQYLYHPLWRVRRDHEKYEDMLEFAGKLPRIRATTRSLLGARRGERDRTLALAIRLLDIGLFRVGWDRYARDNGHVGLTTLGRENVTLRGPGVHFDFVAKSGKRRRMNFSCTGQSAAGNGSTRPM